jgi:hypothetical protein
MLCNQYHQPDKVEKAERIVKLKITLRLERAPVL